MRHISSIRRKASFSFVPPSLVGAYYLQPPDARAIFLNNDLLCNDTCSVTGGSITYWGGGANGKDPEKALIGLFKIRIFPFVPPQLSGRILFAPLRRTCNIFLHNDLLCNGTYSVTGGRITYWGHKRRSQN